MKKFSDFAETEAGLVGDKLKISEVMNKKIVVTGYRMLTQKHNSRPLLHLQFELEGKTHTTFTNSVVLIRQCETYQEEIPFETMIVKQSNYYTFS